MTITFRKIRECEQGSRFRFPAEIQNILRYIIEEPLGWPNGEAGDCFLSEIECAISDNTNYESGKDAFGVGGNYPRLSPQVLFVFHSVLLQSLFEQAKKNPALIGGRSVSDISLHLEHFAQAFRSLEKTSKSPK